MDQNVQSITVERQSGDFSLRHSKLGSREKDKKHSRTIYFQDICLPATYCPLLSSTCESTESPKEHSICALQGLSQV